MYGLLTILKNNFILYRIDWTATFTGLLAIFTAILVIIAFWQLRKFNKTQSAEFMHKLKIDLFNERSILLFTIIENDLLRFIKAKENGIPYFEIDLDNIKDNKIKNEIIRKINNFRGSSYVVDFNELDELLLGHIEDLGILHKKRIIDIEMIYEEFYYNIEKCLENHSIKDYIKYVRNIDGWDIYERANDIFEKCKLYERKKKRNKIILDYINNLPIINRVLKQKRWKW